MKIFDWLFDRKDKTVEDANEVIVNDSDKVCMNEGVTVEGILGVTILIIYIIYLCYLLWTQGHIVSFPFMSP